MNPLKSSILLPILTLVFSGLVATFVSYWLAGRSDALSDLVRPVCGGLEGDAFDDAAVDPPPPVVELGGGRV